VDDVVLVGREWSIDVDLDIFEDGAKMGDELVRDGRGRTA
jgi:hypothetical protein